jgi:thiol-disulfide isomerase/thioredoxin
MKLLRFGAALLLGGISPAAAAGPGLPSSLTLADGQKLSIASLRGRVVVINYWATWCVPCRAELPLLARYYRAHRAQGLIVIGISVDPGPGGRGQAVSSGIPYPQANWVGGPDIRLVTVPTSYVIGRDGRVRYMRAEIFTARSLATLVDPLLAER